MNLNTSFLPLAAGAALLLASCSQERLDLRGDIGSGVYENVAPAGAAQGHIRVKFTSEPSMTKSGAAADVDLSALGEYRMERTFPEAGRFEARHREYGLHLWYDIFFDESKPLTRAANDIAAVDGVDIVEYVQPVTQTSVFPFNDPEASKQWHYYNPGTQAGTVAGSDINVVPAWEVTTGRPDVIVAICDGGLQWDHPDMAQNMWVNQAELNGQPGVDDDGNGYVDDIYGYNFLVSSSGYGMKGTITPGDHGTHVGGTVAAVNNNGLGVSGIAGGDGSPESGVRLMSTQTSDGSAYIGSAFVYAADNGAVLINCSWSIEGNSTPQSVTTGINYFNECAGIDPDTKTQTGPMAGGLCIFAAGNENRNTQAYPAMDDNVMAVASIGADFKRAYYSNYGSWVDITAPGGDANKGFEVLSTLPNNSYGSMQGTSMACPHVTGVAALVVSQFGGQGFTRQNLIDILTGTANTKLYDYNQGFIGQLGSGLVDAGAAVSVSTTAPAAVTDFSGEVSGNTASLNWTVPGEGMTLPQGFTITYGDKEISVARAGAASSSKMTCSVSGLDFDTEYHFNISSLSAFGTSTPGGPEVVLKTAANLPPVVTPLDGTSLTLKSFETGYLRFKASDPDGGNLSCSLSEGLEGAVAGFTGDLLVIEVDALKAADGKTYDGSLYVTDGQLTVETQFTYTIQKNNPPVASSAIENIVFGKLGETSRVDLTSHFSDADGENLEYEIKIPSSNSTVKCSLTGNDLNLTAASYGSVTLTMKASDARGESVSQTFSVLVRDGSRPVDLYPNPVKDNLFVRMGSVMDADVLISSQSGATVLKSEGAKMDPFAPLKFDMSSLPGGTYYVRVKGDGIDEVYPIAKQ